MNELSEQIKRLQQGTPRPSADICKTPSVTIAIPAMGTHKSVMSVSLAALAAHSIMHGIQINIVGHDLSGIARNRNQLAQTAIQSGSTHILMLDSDMAFPPDLLIKLLLHGRDIVGVPYPRRSHPYELLGRPKYPEQGDQSGVVEMVMLPAGLLLVKTDVFKSLPQPWFWESYKYEGDIINQFLNVMFDAFSTPIPHEFLEVLDMAAIEKYLQNKEIAFTQDRSEDINFGFKAQRHGYQLWGDLDLLRQIGHIGEQVVRVGGQDNDAI